MQEWKQAFGLAMFELTNHKRNFLWALLYYILFAYFLTIIFDNYLESGNVVFDALFLLLFTFAPAWLEPKETRVQKISGDLWASPMLVMCRQLPISKDVLIKSRFIIYFFYSFPYQLLFFIIIYIFSADLQAALSPLSYIAFLVIWLSFGIYGGYIMPMSDVGDIADSKKMWFYSIAIYGGAIILLLIYHFTFQYGIVHWTIIFAQKWPSLSAILSILLAIFGFKHWEYYMKKTMNKMDYL